jgi:hypothetical protein
VRVALEFDEGVNDDIKEWEDIEPKIKEYDEKLGKATEGSKEFEKLSKEKLECENRKKELEPKINKYRAINNPKTADLSLIMAIRLKDESLIDVARIGVYADKRK